MNSLAPALFLASLKITAVLTEATYSIGRPSGLSGHSKVTMFLK